MPAKPPEKLPRIIPYLLYEDLAAALGWLARVFGFRERMRMPGPEGKITHAEMEYQGGVIMMGHPGTAYRNPRRLGQVTQYLYIYVDDVDKHCERARVAGAEIVDEPADQLYGDRRYSARDPEGHHWFFAQHLRDVAPEEKRGA
jgi:uncharacterized glyoxalase superfamily protein PhnB